MVKQKHRRGVFNDMAALQATVNFEMNKELKFEVRSETWATLQQISAEGT